MRENYAMSRLRRTSIVAALAAGLFVVVSSLGIESWRGPTGSDRGSALSGSDAGESTGSAVSEGVQLAARYHLRGRTTRFFQRAAGPQRSGPAKVKARRGRTGRRYGAVASETPDLLAARYHLRGRTGRFFRRAAA